MGINPYLTGNGTYHRVIISRKNLHFDAMFMQLSDGTGSRWLGRIQKCQVTDEYHVAFILYTEITLLVQVTLLGYGNDPHTLTVHLLTDFLSLPFQFG